MSRRVRSFDSRQHRCAVGSSAVLNVHNACGSMSHHRAPRSWRHGEPRGLAGSCGALNHRAPAAQAVGLSDLGEPRPGEGNEPVSDLVDRRHPNGFKASAKSCAAPTLVATGLSSGRLTTDTRYGHCAC